ncbi:MAG: RHS repeat-associated core domain-containing protein [Bacteroidota bacterium]
MKKFLHILFFLAGIVYSLPGYCSIDNTRAITDKDRALYNYGNFEVRDEKFGNAAFDYSKFQTLSKQAFVSLRVGDIPSAMLSAASGSVLTFQVDVTITPYNDLANPDVAGAPVTTTLTVTYNKDKGTTFKGIDTYELTGGAYRMKIAITDVRCPEITATVTKANIKGLQLEANVVINRKYILQASGVVDVGAFTVLSTLRATAKQLNIACQAIGAEDFDIELATLDNGSEFTSTINGMLANSQTLTDTQLDQLFLNNATRVAAAPLTKDHTFSLIFDNDYVVVRTRTVNFDAAGNRITGNWKYKCKKDGGATESYTIFNNVWNDSQKNWQYAAAFAENGKSKETISYFDGSLRNRQTVSIVNTETGSTPVVQEDIYDQFGRKAASVLPAPVLDTDPANPSLHYFENFNQNNDASPKPYSIADIAGLAGDCEVLPKKMSNGFGAAKYYSSGNPFQSTIFKNNSAIPDALGYPFSVLQYTRDNTGRIKLQGGVGQTFQPGFGGSGVLSHTTKYFYGKPEQWELDQMFGNDVGYAEHYTKNMVIDPNGQISLTYQNASGKTIATALTGPSPANLDALPSKDENVRKTNTRLLNPSQFSFSGSDLKITATTTYMAALPDNNVTLEVNIQQLKETHPNNGLCSNCYYRLTLNVTDDCGNVVYTNGALNREIGSKTSDCLYNDATPIKTFTGINFSRPGEYTVSIEFAMDKDVIENYTDNFVVSAIGTGYLQKKYTYIRQKYLASINLAGSYKDCTTCQLFEQQGKPAFISRLQERFNAFGIDVTTPSADKTDFGEWADSLFDSLKLQCEALRDGCVFSPCSSVETLMLSDVSPGGQYARFTGDAPLEQGINVLSRRFGDVFGPSHLPSGALTDDDYITISDGVKMSVYDANFDFDLMLNYWNPNWASKFLKYHPEFCKLQFCQLNSDSKEWDEKVSNLVTRTDNIKMINGGIDMAYTDNTPALLLGLDPFFKTPQGQPYYNDMYQDLQFYTSRVLQLTGANFPNSISLSKYVRALLSCKTINSQGKEAIDWNCTATCIAPQKEWQLYRDLYLQLKEQYYQKVMAATTCLGVDACPIGTQVDISVGGLTSTCPLPGSFTFDWDTTRPPCEAAKTIKITYQGNNIRGNTILRLTYPEDVVTYRRYVSSFPEAPAIAFPVLREITFVPGQREAYICVPDHADIKGIRVQSVTCATPAAPVAGRYIKFKHEVTTNWVRLFQWYDYLFGIGAHKWDDFPNSVDKITATLVDESGNTVKATAEITVNLKYEKNYIVENSTAHHADNIAIVYDRPLIIPNDASEGVISVQVSRWYRTDYPNARIQSDLNRSMNQITLPAGYNLYTRDGTSTNVTVTTTTTTVSTCNPLLAFKTSRFAQAIVNAPAATRLTDADMASMLAENQNKASEAVAINCAANVDLLMSKLQPYIPAGKVVEMRAKLIDVCIAGGDINHFAGASVLAYNASPSYNSTPKSMSLLGHTSFGSVIKQVASISSFTNDLNPWLIGAPVPYDMPQQATTKMIASTDASICARLTSLSGMYTATLTGGQTYSDAGFYNYLVNKFGSGMTISQSQLSSIILSCGNCNELLPKGVILPPFFDPSGTGYISKTQYTAALTDLNTQFNNSINVNSSNYETILTNFMNMKFGFSLAYKAYKDFNDNPSGSALLVNAPRFKEVEIDPFARAVSLVDNALATGALDYDRYINDAKDVFRAKYIATCSAAQAYTNINTRTPQYHYTLYYYDQADNLVRTVPPEGVRLITDETQLQKVQDARTQPVVTACTTGYNGPKVNSTPAQIFGAMETNFNDKVGGTIEMWLYNAGSNPSRVIQATPNGTYQFQLVQNGSLLSVEILSSPYNGSFQKNNRVVLNLAATATLQAWNHITIYSSDFVSVAPQVLINGIMAPRANFQGSWSVSGSDLSSLKFLRLYSGRKMPIGELQLNALSNCFTALYTDHQWFRYNLPSVGGETTTTTTGTVEFKDPGIYPTHKLATTYMYNTTNQVVKQSSPDGGTNRYWYDLLSRLIFSQNDNQKPNNYYSYTVYEATLGRISEVGQKKYTGTVLTEPDFVEDVDRAAIFAITDNTQITKTVYDARPGTGSGLTGALIQDNLRKRVAATYYRETAASAVTQATYYSYDVTGNVKTLWQQVDGLTATTAPKRIDYEYDLISGKVNFLRYQDNSPDQFYYKFNYDAENRITEAWSGTKAVVDQYTGSRLVNGNARRDAKYYYYLHGALARTVLGDELTPVQGVDYTYTLQGWLKGINSTNLGYDKDPSQDGSPGSSLQGSTLKTKDAYGFALHYFGADDYTPIGGVNPFADASGATGFNALYNGNIAASSVNIAFPNATAIQGPLLYNYGYDQLNRLTRQNVFQGLSLTSNTWTPVATNAFKEAVSYDANGNIKTYDRYDNNGAKIDGLTYKYDTDIAGNPISNKLNSIKDNVSASVSTVDIDNQADNNYKYDEIGNLVADGTLTYEWNIYGKLKKVINLGLTYGYNAAQQRVSKSTTALKTYYVRDAQGNTLAIYEKAGANPVSWKEQNLYGSERLGNWLPNIANIDNSAGQANTQWQNFGLKRYELNNHLGNMLVTISDRQVKDPTGANDFMTADVINAQDYYPFGMPQPGRQYALSSVYRYGFNGKENDNDVGKGNGNQQDYGMRIYDPRVGRFLSIDPLSPTYPELTPYQFGSNSPIGFIDLDGLEAANPKKHVDYYDYFLRGLRNGLADQGEEAIALAQYLTSKDGQKRVNSMADQLMRNPAKFLREIDKRLSNSAKDVAIDATIDISKIALNLLIGNKKKAAYESGEFVANYGLILLLPEEEGAARLAEKRVSQTLSKDVLGKTLAKGEWEVLTTTMKYDKGAHALAEEINGVAQARFKGLDREFDAISDKYIGQHKPALGDNIGGRFKEQARATFDAAKKSGREVFYRFDSRPSQKVINKLNQYSKEYGVKLTIKY